MKHFIFILFSLSMFVTHAQESLYAVQLCSEKDKEGFQSWCLLKQIEFVTFLEHRFAVIKVSDFRNISPNNFCYITKVKVHEKMLSINTNTILLRLHKGAETNFLAKWSYKFNIERHAFIPDYFIIRNVGKTESEVHAFLEQLQNVPEVQYAGINQIFTIEAASNDPYYNRQWNIANTASSIQGSGTVNADMNVDTAWANLFYSYNPKVAILDSGVDTLHEDLVDNILPGFDALADSVSDTHGAPTPNYTTDGHGTACAGIVGAMVDNNKGIAGIAPMSKIIPIRIFRYKDYGSGIGVQATTNTEALVDGPAWAWRVANADIMSVSAGLSDIYVSVLSIDKTLVNNEINEAYFQARNGKGIAMFFSAGNDDEAIVLWPANLENTIAVGASEMCDKRKKPGDCSGENWGSSYGVSLDVVAPGVRISTTDITGIKGFAGGEYNFTFNGTSAACPNAAGVGALLLSIREDLHARDIKTILNKTADKISGYTYDTITPFGTWNLEVGHGRVNALKAINMAESFQSTVGVKSISSTTEINIYPNPACKTIWLDNVSDKDDYVVIYNMLGQAFRTIETPAHSHISLSLEPGLYFLKQSKSRDTIQRIIME